MKKYLNSFSFSKIMDEKEYSQQDIEIADIENYKSGGESTFNYQFLVMKCVSNCIEAGKHELRTGWTNEKVDNSGNITRTYIEDTRKRFIESIKTFKSILEREFDLDAKTNIKKIDEKLQEKKTELLEEQWNWYESLAPIPKEEWRNYFVKGFFTQTLGWYQAFVEFEIECYREILVELMKLTHRRDDFKGEDFEA